MLGARYQTLAVDVQDRYVRCTISDTSSRSAAQVCQVQPVRHQQQMCRNGMLGTGFQTLAVDVQQVKLGARYQKLVVDVQHRYFRCTLSDTSSRCAALVCQEHADTSSICAVTVCQVHAIRDQKMCSNAMLGARYQKIAVDVTKVRQVHAIRHQQQCAAPVRQVHAISHQQQMCSRVCQVHAIRNQK